MLFRTSADEEDRRLVLIGSVVLVCFATIVALIVTNPFASEKNDIAITIDTPYVGQGVAANTPLMMHGVTVGKIATVASLPSGVVRIKASLDAKPAAGLTDRVGIDFRPANYFGVTGLNVIPADGGERLRDGTHIATQPQGNFTLQALLTRTGAITGNVITPQLVSVMNRATQYTDGLNPLIETMLTAADSVAKVQTVSTAQLLRNATGISAAFPGFADGATAAGYGWNQGSSAVTFKVSGEPALPGQKLVAVVGQTVTEQYWRERAIPTLKVVSDSLFGKIGKLESSHATELLPVVTAVRSLTDTVPALVTPVGLNDTLVELRTRFEKLYGGSPEQRAMQVHVILDQIPGVQAPINAMGGAS